MGRDQHHGHRGVYLTIGEAGVLKLHFICLLNFWDFFLVEISSKTLNVFHRRGSMSKCQAVKKGKNLAWMLLNLPKGCAYARVHKYAKVIRIPIGSKPSRRWEIYTPERRDIPAMTWLWDRWGSTSSCVFTSCTITPTSSSSQFTRDSSMISGGAPPRLLQARSVQRCCRPPPQSSCGHNPAAYW